MPGFEFVERRAEQLASDDLMLEPRLGEVRITWVADVGYDPVRHVSLVQLYWTDGAGFSAAARSLPAHEHVTVRVPDLQDEAAVYRAIERARYLKINLDHRSARLIAAPPATRSWQRPVSPGRHRRSALVGARRA